MGGFGAFAHRAAAGDPATIIFTAGAGTPGWSGIVLAYLSAGPASGAASASGVSPLQAPAAQVWGVETILECWADSVVGLAITTNVNSPTVRANVAASGAAPALLVAEFQTNIAASSMTGDTASDPGANITALTAALLS